MSESKDQPQLSMFGEAPSPRPKPVRITLSKTFNSSAQNVFDQWLIPVFLENWMFGPKVAGEQIISLENEVRSGGAIRYAIVRGGVEKTYAGSFTKLRIPKEMVLEWRLFDEAEPDKISVQFEEADGKTRVKLAHWISADSDETAESAKARWNSRFTVLASRLNK